MNGNPFKACSIDGCGGNAGAKGTAKGFCSAHYNRLRRHGSPLLGGTPEGEPLEWLKSTLLVETEECVIWPYGTNNQGYGSILFEGQIMGAHRAVCIMVHGAPQDGNLVARHTCGKGTDACVNHRHLQWGTYADNSADFAYHVHMGVVPRKSCQKITRDDAEVIRSRRGEAKIAALAAEYGVSESMISRIHSGKRW